MKIEKYTKELSLYLQWFATITKKYSAKTRRELLMRIDTADMDAIMAWCKKLNAMTMALGLNGDQIEIIDQKTLSSLTG